MTRFKIDWGDGEENIENMPPSTLLEDNAASNQMMSIDCNMGGKSLGDVEASSLSKGPLLSANASNSCSNGLELINNRMTAELKSHVAEPMQM